jgi:hypothetical protein
MNSRSKQSGPGKQSNPPGGHGLRSWRFQPPVEGGRDCLPPFICVFVYGFNPAGEDCFTSTARSFAMTMKLRSIRANAPHYYFFYLSFPPYRYDLFPIMLPHPVY